MPLPLGPLRSQLESLLAGLPALSPRYLGLFGAAVATTGIGIAIYTSGIFSNAPYRMNDLIEAGDPARALSKLEEQLASSPEDPALNLLALKARLALCQQSGCVTEGLNGALPDRLASLPKLAANVTGPVVLQKDTPPLTLEGVYTQAMPGYETASAQPAAVLAFYGATPPTLKPHMAKALFQPALTLVRKGEDARAAAILARLSKADGLPETYTYAAGMLSGMFGGQPSLRNTNLIALRSTGTPPIPITAAALIPWAVKADAGTSGTLPTDVLSTLPDRIEKLNLQADLSAKALPGMAQELVSTSQISSAAQQWNKGWQGTPATLTMALQRTALMLDPNQPDLWATYLPALISTTSTESSSSLAGLAGGTFNFKPGSINSATTPRIGNLVLDAAKQLQNAPGVATPLVMFASKLNLSKQQNIDLEKVSQALLLKAAEQGDVTSTVILAENLPGVAQNNRQSVVPLLVKFIRDKLREGNFEAATNTADLLTNTLQMDVEFAPLVLEEFTDDLKRRHVLEELNASSPTILLQPQEDATLDLGPLFTFMQSYFEDQPKVITAQLTTLVAEATGTYGQATAMYRLGPSFPTATLPPEKQQEWLASSIEASLLADTSLDAEGLAGLAARLSEIHPELNLAPLMETAIKRAPTLEDQRALWQSATPRVREVLRAIRPEFTALMQGVDALAAGRLNQAAQSFASMETPGWKDEAQPFIEQFNDKLIDLSGIYVPVSAAPTLKTAAILVAPQALQGGKLTAVSVTFISRQGTLSEAEPASLRTNAAATHRFGLTVPYNFDTRTLTLSPQTVAQTPGGGTFNTTYGAIRSLKLQTSEDGGTPSSVLTVTLASGQATPYIRTLLNPEDALRPDGIYTLQTRLSPAVSATQGILPPGTMMTLTTENAYMKTPADADTKATQVMPLTGTIRHPASANPINVTGYFEPETLTATFAFSYPLPQSAQPAKAAVRCQALAGPIICGAHNLNSARQAYAAIVSGLQTRESLTKSAADRSSQNSFSSAHIMANLAPKTDVSSTEISATTISTTSAVTPTESDDKLPTISVSTKPEVSKSTAVSKTEPTAKEKSKPENKEEAKPAELLPAPDLSEEEQAEEEVAPAKVTKPSSTEPEPGAFINRSGGKKPVAPSPTTTP